MCVYNEPIAIEGDEARRSFLDSRRSVPSTAPNKPMTLKAQAEVVRRVCGGERRSTPLTRPSLVLSGLAGWPCFFLPQKDRKNEIFIDMLERLTVLFGANGAVLRAEIDGAIQMKSFLNGQPELRVGLNEDLHIGKGHGGAFVRAWVSLRAHSLPLFSRSRLKAATGASTWTTAISTSVCRSMNSTRRAPWCCAPPTAKCVWTRVFFHFVVILTSLFPLFSLR